MKTNKERYSEKQLVSALKNQEESAFSTLIDLYRDSVIRISRGMIGSYTDAEDLAQEVFLEIFRSIRKFSGKSSLSTWIYRITVNKTLNYIRDKASQKSVPDKQYASETRMLISPDNTDDDIQRSEHAKALHIAINSLPENQQTAFVLAKYEDSDYNEIAEIMGLSLSAVESLLFRAKRNLQKKLYDYYVNNLK